jgi:hypothetical protein
MDDNPRTAVSKHFTSSILLWMRSDKPRQDGMGGRLMALRK